MSRVYLFGAGASHSYSLSPTKKNPPLAKNFFSTLYDLNLAKDPYVLLGNIVKYISVTRNISPIEIIHWEENIESFLAEIDEKLSDFSVAKELGLEEAFLYGRVYDEMLFVFTYLLNIIQNGPTCQNYNSLVQQLNLEDRLITFNWDTLLDKSLWETGSWHPFDGYNLEFQAYYQDGWLKKRPSFQSKFHLLKLHGSTNWLMPYYTFGLKERKRIFVNNSIKPDEKPMFVYIHESQKYITYKNRSKTGFEPFSYYYYPPNIPIAAHHEKGMTNYSLGFDPKVFATEGKVEWEIHNSSQEFASMPLIIPPVKRKEYSLLGNALGGLWEAAVTAINRANKIFIIGYSFPETDIEAVNLFKKAGEQRDSMLDITIIDPFPESTSRRLEKSLGKKCKITSIPLTFNAYVKEYFSKRC